MIKIFASGLTKFTFELPLMITSLHYVTKYISNDMITTSLNIDINDNNLSTGDDNYKVPIISSHT